MVDRLGYKRTSIAADLASGATVAAIPLLHLTVGLAFWQLLLLVFLGALLDVPGGSARFALIPDLARTAGMSVERAKSANSAIPRSATLLEPITSGGPDVWAQVHHAARKEWALTVEEVVRRWTTLAIRGLDTPRVSERIDDVIRGVALRRCPVETGAPG